MKKEIYLNEFNILMENRVYLPSSSGMLRAYAESKKEIRENCYFKTFLSIRDNPYHIFKNYHNPAVAGFSSSMWNHQLNLTLARMVKGKFPDCLIVFGGPHVPNNSQYFLKKYPFVDIVVHGEGEVAFAELLVTFFKRDRSYSGRDFKNIPGISYRHPESGRCIKTQDRPLLRDIDSLPSPYLTGLYNELINKGDFQYQVIFETMRGCPFKCSYCYWGHNNKGPLRKFSLERLKKEIEWMAQNKIQYVFCADSNFGMFRRDLKISQLFVEAKEKYGYPLTFRVCYGKNAEENNFQVARLLNENGLTKGVTLSRQSNSPIVLANIKRSNISMGAYERLQKRYHRLGIPVYTEFILGLPGETYGSFVKGIQETIEAGLHDQINIFFCEVLPNTDMTDPEYVKQYGIQTKRIELAEFHASKRKKDEVAEYENIIVTTDTMPLEDWKKASTFAWIIQIFHGLKLGFFVCAYLSDKFKVKYADFCRFILVKAHEVRKFPVFGKELRYHKKFLESLLLGNPQCIFLDDFGDVSWAIDEASYLNFSKRREEFFDEFLSITLEYLRKSKYEFNEDELKEVFLYQKVRVPNYRPIAVKEFDFKFNISEYFDNFLSDRRIEIKEFPQKLILDNPKDFNGEKKKFAREIVWFSRKDKGIVHAIKWQPRLG